jgi:hypothetical protein
MCELLTMCVKAHGYRMRYFVMLNNIAAKVLRLLQAPEKFLRLGKEAGEPVQTLGLTPCFLSTSVGLVRACLAAICRWGRGSRAYRRAGRRAPVGMTVIRPHGVSPMSPARCGPCQLDPCLILRVASPALPLVLSQRRCGSCARSCRPRTTSTCGTWSRPTCSRPCWRSSSRTASTTPTSSTRPSSSSWSSSAR